MTDSQDEKKWYDRTRYQILLFVGGILLFVLAGGWILDWYINPHTSGQKKDLVQALGLLTAGVAGAVGIYFTWRGQRLTQKGLQDTLRITREGQITERFTRAIDQLGKVEDGKKLFEIRVGGIYALERIARESEEDHWSIMEVLTTYVRQHTPRRPEKAQQVEKDAVVEKKSEEDSKEDSRGESKPTEVPGLATDIQAIMTVIRRRTRSFNHGEPERLDLRETNLWRANLSGANLCSADLAGANLDRADLSGANLSGANLSGADLSGADLSGAKLSDAYLSDADLSVANLSGAFLVEANLSGANLVRANLVRANLWMAQLADANLLGANLLGAILLEARLSGANLLAAEHLTQTRLEETMSGDKNTQLPPDLKPPAHWNVKIDEQNEGD